MNETLKTIKSRRSIRRYQPGQIREEELQAILDAAIAAPTAMFQQKWHFTVVQKKEILNRIREVARQNMLGSGMDFMVQRAKDPGFSPFHKAPTVIIASCREDAKFADLDCALAAQNILLAAESMGIGSCIMTSSELWFNGNAGDELKKELGIPDEYRHVCAVTLGYKAEEELPDRTRETKVVNYIR